MGETESASDIDSDDEVIESDHDSASEVDISTHHEKEDSGENLGDEES